jgi:hypothetical protein
MKSRARRRRMLVASPLIAAIVACGSGGAPGRAASSPTVACGHLFDALTVYAECGPANGSLGRRDGFVQSCVLQLDAPGTKGAADAAEHCAEAIQTAARTCGSADAACVAPAGALPAGAPCGTSMQCASGYCGTGVGIGGSIGMAPSFFDFAAGAAGAAGCSVCTDKVPIGQSCCAAGAGPPCVAGAICSKDACQGPCSCFGAGACVAAPAADVGGSCATVLCKSGLHCDRSGLTCVNNGRMLAKQAGEPCSIGMDGTSACAAATTCDSATMTCKPLGAPGAPCDFGGLGPCRIGYCDVRTSSNGGQATASGTCPLVIPDGQPCDPSMSNATCDDYASCVAGASGVPEAAAPAGDAGSGFRCALFDPPACN